MASHLLVLAFASVPTVRIAGGLDMPVMAAGTGGYKGPAAAAAVAQAIALGMTHVHTAFDYFNLDGGLADVFATAGRQRLWISSMTSPCVHPGAPPKRYVTDETACFNLTLREAGAVLQQLRLDYVDLLMLHGPNEEFGHVGQCSPRACALNRAQWRAYESLLRAKRARAIGVSNYCASCLKCLMEGDDDAAAATPAVNQIQLHVGMGADPGGLLSYCAARGIVVQAYESLAGGEVVDDALCRAVGARHNRSAAAAGLRWVLDRAPALAVKAGTTAHLREDLDAWSWQLDAKDAAALDAATVPKGEAGGRCSWGCTE